MRFFAKSIVAAIAFAALSLSAAEVINLTEKGALKRVLGKGDIVYGENQFTVPGWTMLELPKLIKIDPAKKYTVKMTLVGNPQKRVSIYIGYNPSSSKKGGGAAQIWQGAQKSFTQLTRDAKKGDKVIYVKDAKGWIKTASYASIAFNAKEDGSDLPNKELYASNILSVKQEGEEWAIEFKTPLRKNIPANTGVRQHFAGGYMYIFANSLAPNQERTFSATTQGHAKAVSRYSSTVWPINVDQAKLVLLLDWGRPTNTPVTIKDATLTIE